MKKCVYCGAAMKEGAKICTNCGKVAPSEQLNGNQFSNFGGPQGMTPGAKNTARTTYAATRSAKQMKYADDKYGNGPRRRVDENYDPVKQSKQKVPFVTNESSGKEKHRSRIIPVVKLLIKIALVLFILYAAFGFARVMMVKSASYDFKLGEGMKLTSENYGDAFDNYFTDGKWSYELKGNCVTYKGTAQDGGEYEMTFGKSEGQTAVLTLTIDGKKIDSEKIMPQYVLGMFMSEKMVTQ
ncbi:zinc ribbon domain-containing protein [uncultured Ruminococcus sp.]|uniref:zinc ribbon domain-containing protein n=1 Tax=uncultured Ruminococcus sp. TaxID=165186 RepID=UPI0025F43945|nr:zinc ribbon domain-containing protein [uncultured Ruminococcus sp.]